MSKYIDVEKIPWTDLNDGRGGVNVYVTFLEKVARMPAADVAEVRHGRWIMHIDDLFPAESTMECSQCHEEQALECDDNYCPHCGAKMDEVEE